MANVVMDHRVSWCFGTSLAPRSRAVAKIDIGGIARSPRNAY